MNATDVALLVMLGAGLAWSARGAWNAWRRVGSVTRIVRKRRHDIAISEDPLGIFDEEELRLLVQTRKGRPIPGTRIPDPWQTGLHLSYRRLAINANVLRFKADAWQAAFDVLIVIASVFAGVYAIDFIQTFAVPGTPRIGWWAFAVSVAILILATILRLWVIPVWRAPAEKYRELALRSQKSRVRPSTGRSRRPIFPRIRSQRRRRAKAIDLHAMS